VGFGVRVILHLLASQLEETTKTAAVCVAIHRGWQMVVFHFQDQIFHLIKIYTSTPAPTTDRTRLQRDAPSRCKSALIQARSVVRVLATAKKRATLFF
jgi:hypothetical protein